MLNLYYWDFSATFKSSAYSYCVSYLEQGSQSHCKVGTNPLEVTLALLRLQATASLAARWSQSSQSSSLARVREVTQFEAYLANIAILGLWVISLLGFWVIWWQCCLRVAAGPCLPNGPIAHFSPYLTQKNGKSLSVCPNDQHHCIKKYRT